MWPVSDRFLEALTTSHTIVSEADVWRDGGLVYSGLPIVSGSVKVDEGSRVRRTLTLAVGDPSLSPIDADSLLAPVGTELHVRSGIRFFDGSTELVPVGVFRVQNVDVPDWGGQVTVQGSDRTSALADDRFIIPRNTAAGTKVVAEITALVLATIPDAEVFDETGADDVLAAAATWDRNRDEAVETLAASIGAEAFFNAAGQFIIRPIPQVPADIQVGDEDWAVASGDGGVLVQAGVSMSREGVYNGVAVVGQAVDGLNGPPSALAVVADGTYAWGGAFGHKPIFYTSSLIFSYDQALNVARSRVGLLSPLQRVVTPEVLPNPALAAGDVLLVELPDGDQAFHVVSGFDLPLGPGTVSLSTRVAVQTDEEDT